VELFFLGGEQRVELLLEVVIVDAVVQFGARLHGVDDVLLVPSRRIAP
jgi:hypothetical protein